MTTSPSGEGPSVTPLHARIDIVHGVHHVTINGQLFAEAEDFVAATNLLATQAAAYGRSVHVELPARGKIPSKFFHIDVDGSISKTAAPVALAATATSTPDNNRTATAPRQPESTPRVAPAPSTSQQPAPRSSRARSALHKTFAPLALAAVCVAAFVTTSHLRAELASAEEDAAAREALYLLAPPEPAAVLAQANRQPGPRTASAARTALDNHLAGLGYTAETSSVQAPAHADSALVWTRVVATTTSPARLLADLAAVPFPVSISDLDVDATRVTLTVGTRPPVAPPTTR